MTTPGDTAFHEAVMDLLGVLAYGELTSCLQLAAAGEAAPTLSVASQLAALSATKYRHHADLVDRLGSLGVDADAAMQPYVVPFRDYHARTHPHGWLEALMKAYVGEGISRDFYREMASFVDTDTRTVLDAVLDDADTDAFMVTLLKDAMAVDPAEQGRLALWGRRLVGEALSQAQTVAVTRDTLAGLLVGTGADLAEVGRMFTRLTDHHKARMARLGLDP